MRCRVALPGGGLLLHASLLQLHVAMVLMLRPPPARANLVYISDAPVAEVAHAPSDVTTITRRRSGAFKDLPAAAERPYGVAVARLADTLLHAVATPSLKAANHNGTRELGHATAGPRWRDDARELAVWLLANREILNLLLSEPAIASAMARELQDLGCTRWQETEENNEGDDDDEEDEQRRQQRPPPPPPPPPPQPHQATTRGHAEDENDSDALLRPWPMDLLGSCGADADCPVGEYCNLARSCADCSIISRDLCNALSENCCSTSFLKQCQDTNTNPHRGKGPAGCCERAEDCGTGYYCVEAKWGPKSGPSDPHAWKPSVCKEASHDEAALLAAFVRDPRDEAGWSTLRGWSEATSPCSGLGWSGVGCEAEWAYKVDWSGMKNVRFQLGSAVGRLRHLRQLFLPYTGLYGTIPIELTGEKRRISCCLHI